MSEPITGGPAFPGQIEIGRVVEYDEHLDQNVSRQLLEIHSGMTLRDFFAAAALTGILADRIDPLDEQEAAESAYIHADAMIVARDKPNP